jgi:hypothetical protein
MTSQPFFFATDCDEELGGRRRFENKVLEENSKGEVFVYPNPSNNKIFIECNKGDLISVLVTDLAGRRVTNFTAKISGRFASVDLNIMNGMYLIQIQTRNEGFVRKIVVEK